MEIEEIIERLKVHNKIHSEKEKRAVHITQAIDEAIQILSKSCFHDLKKEPFDLPPLGQEVVCYYFSQCDDTVTWSKAYRITTHSTNGDFICWKNPDSNNSIGPDNCIYGWLEIPDFDVKVKPTFECQPCTWYLQSEHDIYDEISRSWDFNNFIIKMSDGSKHFAFGCCDEAYDGSVSVNLDFEDDEYEWDWDDIYAWFLYPSPPKIKD